MLSNDKLRFLRTEAGLTQAQIAEECGITIRFVRMIERCQESPSQATHDKWVKLCLDPKKIEEKKKNKPKRAAKKKKESAKEEVKTKTE